MRSVRYILATLILCAAAAVPVVASAPPAVAISTINIWLENGSQALGSDCISSGCIAKDKNHPGRTITWDPFTTYNGDEAGYLQWSNGLFLTATSNCAQITTQTSPDANGVIFALHLSGGHLYYVNRKCDNGSSDAVMASHNSNGSAWTICSLSLSCRGLFTKLLLNPT